jgi:hypothetical protein
MKMKKLLIWLGVGLLVIYAVFALLATADDRDEMVASSSSRLVVAVD